MDIALPARVRFVCALVLLCAAPAWAQVRPQRAITLRDAIAEFARANPTLAAAGADVMIADAGIENARGLDDFVVDGAASWIENRHELVANAPYQTPEYDDVNGFVQLSKPLATGGKVGLRFYNEYSRTQSFFATQEPPLSLSEAYTPALQLVFQHPLLRGFGVDVARAQRRRARVQRDIAGLSRDATAAGLLRDLVAAYWDLAYATQELEIRRASAESARDQLRRVKANIEVGKQPPSASAEVEVTIALREDAVLSAEEAELERSIELERLLGRSAGHESATLSASEPPPPPDGTPELRDMVEAALARNPQLCAARAQGRAALIDVDVTENGLLPQLDLAVAGGPLGSATDPHKAYSQLLGLDTYGLTANLLFQQPLGRHAARGARDAAVATLHKVRLSEKDIELQVESAMVRGVAAVDTARRRAEVLAHSTDAAMLDLAAEKARFEVGRSTNFDVLRRQDELAQAQLAQLRARVDYLKARAVVESLTGDILDRFGLRLR